MTGSIKDRMALHILRRGYERGVLAPGAPIAEATSGNTGISFAALGRALGHPVTIFMPDWMSQERKDLIRSLGAEHPPGEPGGGRLPGQHPLCRRNFAAQNPGCFLPEQFANEDNPAAHAGTTGPEIWWQLRCLGLKPDAFVAGVGTGGTIMGVGGYLKQVHPAVKVHPLEPANSPTLSTGCKVGKHRIQGISDEFIPAIMKLERPGRVIAVDDGDAILMAQKLAGQLGLGVGISSGANLLGRSWPRISWARRPSWSRSSPDDNKKYLSTDLMRQEPAKDGLPESAGRAQGLPRLQAGLRHLLRLRRVRPVPARTTSRPSRTPSWKARRRCWLRQNLERAE